MGFGITIRQIENIASEFIFSDHREYHMVRIVSMFINSLAQEVILIQKLDQLFARIDRNLFELFPLLRHLAWFTALICQTKKSARTRLTCATPGERTPFGRAQGRSSSAHGDDHV
jgi:hypothetical protein